MASLAGNRVNALVLTFTLISGVVVFFRLFTRIAVIRNAGLEDVCITLAMVFSVGLTVTISEQIRYGMGKHIYELTPAEMINSQKTFWASLFVYYLSLTFTKMSILFQYLRVFPTPRFRVVCYVVLAVVVLHGIWTFFGSIFICFPINFFWDKGIPGGRCLDERAVWFTNAGLNIAQDLVILFLPMPVLRKLNIPRRQKKALMTVFAVGGVVCIVSIVRLHSLVAISNSTDPTFDNPPAAALSAVETNIGILTACLPSLRPFLSAIMPTYFPPTVASRYTNGRSYDEERAGHLRASAVVRSPTARTTKRSYHSRSRSTATYSIRTESELGDTYNLDNQQATIAGTGTRVIGPARQVHVRSASHASTFREAPRLPQLPENMATIGFADLQNMHGSRHYRSMSSPISTRSGPRTARTSRTSRTPLFHKPLPITPFPVMIP